jgi:elongation factor G
LRIWNLTEEEIPEDMKSDVAKYREQLIEKIAEQDDEFNDKYLDGEELTYEELLVGLRKGTL